MIACEVWLLRLCACLLVGIALPVVAHASPRLEIIGGLERSLGSLGPGTYRGTVLVTNTGDEVLRLSVRNSGGNLICFYPSAKDLASGDTAVITWHLDGQRILGERSKGITLESNDPAQRSAVLRFTWKIREELRIESSTGSAIILQHDTKGDVWRGVATVKNVGPDTLSIAVPELEQASQYNGLESLVVSPNTAISLSPGDSTPLSIVAKRRTYIPFGSSTPRLHHVEATLAVRASGRQGSTPSAAIAVYGDTLRWIPAELYSTNSFMLLEHDTGRDLWVGSAVLRNIGPDTLMVSAPQLTGWGIDVVDVLPDRTAQLLPGDTLPVFVTTKRRISSCSDASGSPRSLESVNARIVLETSGLYTPVVTIPVYASTAVYVPNAPPQR